MTINALAELQASRLIINADNSAKDGVTKITSWGSDFSQNMLRIDHDPVEGWQSPEIIPFQAINIHPAAPCIQYGMSLFEGMKAFRKPDGTVHLFRPDANMRRMQTSAARLGMPNFSGDELIKLIRALVRFEEAWVPEAPNALYIRPTLIATRPTLGMTGLMAQASLYVFVGPVEPFFSNQFTSVSLLATRDVVRAWPGGTGCYKLAGNYAPCFVPAAAAKELGYDQNLWCLGDEVTEAGQMNFWVVRQNCDETVLFTPSLDGQILPGVTRNSILQLVRSHADGTRLVPGLPNNLTVEERSFTLSDVKEWASNDELLEAFGSGTAAVIAPIKHIGIPQPDSDVISDIQFSNSVNGLGPISRAIFEELKAIQEGRIEGPAGWCVPV